MEAANIATQIHGCGASRLSFALTERRHKKLERTESAGRKRCLAFRDATLDSSVFAQIQIALAQDQLNVAKSTMQMLEELCGDEPCVLELPKLIQAKTAALRFPAMLQKLLNFRS